jgi:thiamine monophosphate synthase
MRRAVRRQVSRGALPGVGMGGIGVTQVVRVLLRGSSIAVVKGWP